MKSAARFVAPAVVFLVYVVIASFYIGEVPMWDGRQYLVHLQQALSGPFNPMAFNLFGHPSMAYFIPLGLSLLADSCNLMMLGLANLLLGGLVLLAYFRVVRHLFPTAGIAESWLLVLPMAVNPAFHACMANLNADFGVLVFFVPFLLALLRRRYFLAALAGAGLVLSKESGVVLFGLSVSGHALVSLLLSPGTPAERLARLARLLPLGIPLLVFGGYLAMRASTPSHALLWSNQDAVGLVGSLLRLDLDRLLLANLLLVFVLQFQWMLSILPVAWVVFCRPWKPAATSAASDARPGTDPALRLDVAFIAFVFLGALFVLTRFRTFVNVRYFLPLFPLLLLLASASLRELLPRLPGVRRGFLAILSTLLLASVFVTADPVSRAIFGTFSFGCHQLLDMTSVTEEYAGYGRDQLVYNLEFMQLGRLQDSFLQDVRPDTGTTIVTHRDANWFSLGPLERGTYRRTACTSDVVNPTYLRVMALIADSKAPSELWYLELPNHPDNQLELQILRTRYLEVEQRVYQHQGYELRATRFVLNGSASG
jgi:hypothetical protein